MFLCTWFQHNGAPPYYSCAVCQRLSEKCPGCMVWFWIWNSNFLACTYTWLEHSQLFSIMLLQLILERNCGIKWNILHVKWTTWDLQMHINFFSSKITSALFTDFLNASMLMKQAEKWAWILWRWWWDKQRYFWSDILCFVGHQKKIEKRREL